MSSDRKPYLAGNWKMNLDRKSGLELVGALRDALEGVSDRDVAVFPPFVYIDEIARACAGSNVRVGAQNMCDEASGAFTGEVSGAMLKDVGAEIVVLGHSERRHIYGESDELIGRKVQAALELDLEVVLCVGETIEERQGGRTEEVVRRQLSEGLAQAGAEDMRAVTIAYEPVWAIGTGHTASPEQAGEVHVYLRGLLSGLYGDAVAESVRIQYGGSVKPANAAELMAVEGVDGALVGGAALDAESFLAIVRFDQ